MKLLHFEKLKPVCPRCKLSTKEEFPLKVASVLRGDEVSIVEGILHCTNTKCLCEYPIIDNIPIIVPNIRSYVSQNIFQIFGRDDLTDSIESLLGDCCGPGSIFDIQRQYLSTYGFDHYGEFDPCEAENNKVHPGYSVQLLKKGLEAIENKFQGPVIDMGCSVGRVTFEIAEVMDDIVLGIDLNYSMLKMASRILHDGIVRYPKRHVGVVYERREFPVSFRKRCNIDFWACDANTLPFPESNFSLACSLNLIDCVISPYDHLSSLSRILKAGGKGIICTPYDWSSAATPFESWIGGHSQRCATRGSSDIILRSLLTDKDHPQAVKGLKIIAENSLFPWILRLHDRSVMNYQVHMIVAEKV